MAADDAPRTSPAGRTPDPRRPARGGRGTRGRRGAGGKRAPKSADAGALTATGPAAGDLRPADRERMARRLRLRDIRRAPASLVFAVVFHVALFWAIREYWPPPELPAEDVRRSVEASFEEELAEVQEQPPAPLEPETPPEQLEPEPTLTESNLDDPDPPAQLAAIGLGAGAARRGGGGGGGLGIGGPTALDPADVVAAGDPFAEFVSDLRRRGLDVVFVVDATGSMQRFIDRAREVIDDVANDLSAVVPGVRLGLVAYRDLADDWVTRASPLDSDRFLLANFLIDLRASGGRRVSADLPEAVEEGLRVAVDELEWREDARRVILVVGDAPYHEEDRSKVLATVRSFARDPHSVLNSLLIRADGGEPSSNELATRDAFERLVQAGGGDSFELVAERRDSGAELRAQVLEATFGREYKDAVDALLALRGPDRRENSVERQLRKRNTKWFARRLRDTPIHSLVVEGAAALMDRALGEACLALLGDALVDVTHRRAALYVLKRALPAARGVTPDLSKPVPADDPDMLRLRSVVESLPPAQRAAPPPVPPR